MPHQISTIDEQWKHIEWIVLKHCSGIAKKVQSDDWKKKKKKTTVATIATVLFEQIRSTIVFTYSSNKCHNIFTKHLFSVVVDYSFIFYYFILTYKKLTSQ